MPSESNKILNHYKNFRKEIDNICIPEILKCVSIMPIYHNEKQVGILCYAIQPTHIYIDCLYVAPEYRRKGLARKKILEFCDIKMPQYEIRLHIINENKIAYDFWNSIFELEPIESNFVDTLYKVKKLKTE